MIALDEDMVGSDPNTVIVQGLKICLGLFVRINNGALFGAHFTPHTGRTGMNTILHHIRDNSGGHITWMAMVARFSAWQQRKPVLADFFRRGTGWGGLVHCSDLAWAATSYDIRFTVGINPLLEYRPTPDPDPTVVTPSANVFKLTQHYTVLTATNGGHPGAMQRIPTNTGGFFFFSDSEPI
jgi:hypothetical protein